MSIRALSSLDHSKYREISHAITFNSLYYRVYVTHSSRFVQLTTPSSTAAPKVGVGICIFMWICTYLAGTALILILTKLPTHVYKLPIPTSLGYIDNSIY